MVIVRENECQTMMKYYYKYINEFDINDNDHELERFKYIYNKKYIDCKLLYLKEKVFNISTLMKTLKILSFIIKFYKFAKSK